MTICVAILVSGFISLRYKRPKYVVITDALPKNPSGKVLKRNLREQYAGLATEERGS